MELLRMVFPADEYPSTEEISGVRLRVRDFPEIVGRGRNWEEAIQSAGERLEAKLIEKMLREESIPKPSEPGENSILIRVPLVTALRTLIYMTMREKQISKKELGMHCDKIALECLLDPKCWTIMNAFEKAFTAVGVEIEIGILRKE